MPTIQSESNGSTKFPATCAALDRGESLNATGEAMRHWRSDAIPLTERGAMVSRDWKSVVP
jgi:hypothetical protein